MELVELNPEGNFNSWEDSKLEEIKQANYTTDIGTCLYENKEIKVWEILLKPNQRLPFRAHNNNYSCSSLTNALLLMRNVNGQINMLRMNKGEHFFGSLKIMAQPFMILKILAKMWLKLQ